MDDNPVVKFRQRIPLVDQKTRIVVNDVDDWMTVIGIAQDRGILPYNTLFKDLVAFNQKAQQFPGTIAEFLCSCEEDLGDF